MDRLSAAVYSEDKRNDLYVSRRGEQLQLFAREYRHARDVDDTNDDIVFNEGAAQDDGDKLVTLSTGEIERKNHARMTYDLFIRILFARKMYPHTGGTARETRKYMSINPKMQRYDVSAWNFIRRPFLNKYREVLLAESYVERRNDATWVITFKLSRKFPQFTLFSWFRWIKKELDRRTVLSSE